MQISGIELILNKWDRSNSPGLTILSLGSDIRTWIPELPRYPAPINMEHLLWHTSGLRDFPHLLWGLSGRSTLLKVQ